MPARRCPYWAIWLDRGAVPARGDLILFDPPPSALLTRHFGAKPQPFGKRVLGIAGDRGHREGPHLLCERQGGCYRQGREPPRRTAAARADRHDPQGLLLRRPSTRTGSTAATPRLAGSAPHPSSGSGGSGAMKALSFPALRHRARAGCRKFRGAGPRLRPARRGLAGDRARSPRSRSMRACHLEKTGETARLNEELKRRTIARVNRPEPVAGIRGVPCGAGTSIRRSRSIPTSRTTRAAGRHRARHTGQSARYRAAARAARVPRWR
jgi:hypothetical protein